MKNIWTFEIKYYKYFSLYIQKENDTLYREIKNTESQKGEKKRQKDRE